MVSPQPNISDTLFDQKSPRSPEEGVSNCHRQTNRRTDGRRNSMIKSAQWADLMKKMFRTKLISKV